MSENPDWCLTVGSPAVILGAVEEVNLDYHEEKARALEEEALTAGWSGGQLHEESVRRGGGCFGDPGEPCSRGGWILTDYDTWVACGTHGPGKDHPEDPDTTIITRVGEPNPHWREDYIPEDDFEPCACDQ